MKADWKVWMLGLCVASTSIFAAQTLPEVKVIGDVEGGVNAIPGSASVITQEELKRSKPFSTNEALRKVSGVYVRDESGSGTPGNVGLRGVDGNRSAKVLLLEDGVPLALAPYGENAAYYFPQIDRMSSIEVLKGSGSILYGPQTVGGVINFITGMPSKTPQWTSVTEMGSHDYFKENITYSGTHGNTGLLFNVLHKQGDGPRDNMPYKLYDVSGKVVIELSPVSDLILRGHYHRNRANLTYLGLTTPMFDANPGQNVADMDELFIERVAASATHRYRGFDAIDELNTTFYAYKTKRHWWRRDFVETNGVITFEDENGGRNRDYDVVGIEPRFTKGNLKGGLKLHYEREHNTRHNNKVNPTVFAPTQVNQDEYRSTLALATYSQYGYDVNEKWRITPGLRVETFKQYRDILINSGSVVNQDGSTDIQVELIPGIGTTYDLNDDVNLFAGVHRGFAPPKFDDAINSTGVDQQLDAERSLNYEAGVRANVGRHVMGATAFYTDYENQVVPTSESGGNTKVNGGETRHVGLELDVTSTYDNVFSSGWTFTNSLAVTYQDARIEGDRFDKNQVNLNADGKPLPYTPHELVTLGFGLKNNKVSYFLEGVYVGDMRAYNIASEEADASREASVDGKTGDIDEHFVVNLSAAYTVNPSVEIFGSIKNVFDAIYVASRRPEGIFPGPTRQINFGVKVNI